MTSNTWNWFRKPERYERKNRDGAQLAMKGSVAGGDANLVGYCGPFYALGLPAVKRWLTGTQNALIPPKELPANRD
jgi:hypothetical protein